MKKIKEGKIKTKIESQFVKSQKNLIEFNSINLFLLIALIALPVAGLKLHLKLHPNTTYLTYILLFDIIIITAFFLFQKTRFYGFALNSVFFLTGVIAHLTVVGLSTISDVLIAIPDFVIGYVLWKLNINNTS